VAAAAGIDRQALYMLESGRTKVPRWPTAARLALVLDIDPYELFPIDSSPDIRKPATVQERALVSDRDEPTNNTQPTRVVLRDKP
jgi:transcriptional regulator with XRE-family HTH domain